jgi:branched-chain amino acid transport system permease protein
MSYELTLLTVMGINVILALSLNLITGYCGQISLGHAAFYGAGAYAAALWATSGGSFWLSLPLAALAAALFGFIVGFASLRVRDDFLAITTMGVGFLFIGMVRQQDALGGEIGIVGIPDHGLGKPGFTATVVVMAGLVTALSVYLKKSWAGFAFRGIAADEGAAAAVGIDIARYKLMAFSIGTGGAGLAGALYAHDTKYVGVDSFGFVESISILVMVVVGGVGSVFGVLVAAAVLSVLPLWLQFIADYKLLLYGALLFAVMRFAPGGLDGLLRLVLSKARSAAVGENGDRTAEDSPASRPLSGH